MTEILGSNKSIWGFDPRNVAGCRLWLDGADRNSMTFSGLNITQWNDKSGNGYHAVPASGRIAAVYSSDYNAVNFTTSNTGYVTSYPANPVTETMFVVFNNPSPSSANNLIIGGQSGARSLGGGGYSSSTGFNSIGNLKNSLDWLASTPQNSYTPGTTVLVTSDFSSTSNSISINAGTVVSEQVSGFTAGTTTHLGVDTTTSLSYYYIGYVMEIIFYDSVLSTSEREQVEGYLAWKWAIRTSMPTTHPFYSIRPYLRTFNPVDISGCALWLDGADQSSTGMTLSGANVLSWNDKSGNGRNLTASSSYPTITTNGLLFNGSTPTILSNAGSFTTSTGLNSFVVFRSTVASTRQRVFVYSYSGQKLLSQVDTTFNTVASSNVIGDGSISYSANTTYLYSGNTTSSAAISYSVNGFQNSFSSTSASTNATQTKLIVGGESTVYFTGTIQEIILYDAFLTITQRRQVEGYLAWKWGLQSSLLINHPFNSFPSSSALPFSPRNIQGCQLWLDGNDPAGTGTQPASGSLATWVDKSGNGRNGTQVNNPTYDSSRKAVYFSGSQYYSLPDSTFPTGNTSYTYFMIVNFSIINGGGVLGGGGFTGSDSIGFRNNGVGGGFVALWFNNDIVSPTTYSPNQIVSIVSFYTSGGSRSLIQNFTTTTSNTPTTPRNQSVGNNAVGRTFSSEYMTGYIHEVIVYNTALTTSQRQQVEGYLAWKWGIMSLVPSTHPYYRFQPPFKF